jgi:hypothetical protein
LPLSIPTPVLLGDRGPGPGLTRAWRPTAPIGRNAGAGLSVFQVANTTVSCRRSCGWHPHAGTTSLAMTHVGLRQKSLESLIGGSTGRRESEILEAL